MMDDRKIGAGGLNMFGAVGSIVKAVLWIFNIALTFFILAMTVSPQAAAGNVANWISVLGFKSLASWINAHSATTIHFSTHAAPHMTMRVHGHAVPESGVDIPDVAIFAAGVLIASLVVIYVLRRRNDGIGASIR
jgi:hypothetical protein